MLKNSEFWKVSDSNDNSNLIGNYCFHHEAIMEGKAKYHNADFYIFKCIYTNEEGSWEIVGNPEFIPSSYEYVPIAVPFKLF
jgi:hypothetical protein